MRVTGAADNCTLTTQPFLEVGRGCGARDDWQGGAACCCSALLLGPPVQAVRGCGRRSHPESSAVTRSHRRFAARPQANEGNLPLAVPRCGPPTLPPDAVDGFEMAWGDALGPARIPEASACMGCCACFTDASL